ncbi:hypothetical protein QT352_16370 [Escherichia coli]|nr:hypothetical protein [Escherichia coli]
MTEAKMHVSQAIKELPSMVPLKLVIMEKYLAILSRHSAFTPRIPYGQCRQPVFFSGGKAASRIPLAATCGLDAAKNILKLSSDNKTTVIFTHNHCLTQIAKKMKWWKLKPEYLETLVLHIENNRLILDGKLTHDKA